MKIVISVIMSLIVGVLIGVNLPKNPPSSYNSAEYKAFLERDNAGIMQEGDYGGLISEAQQTRWQNHLVYREGMFPVDTVVQVNVNKTGDTGDYVITMTNVDGEIASLWTTGTNVSGLTNY